MKYLLTGLYIIFSSLGIFLMKIGGDSLKIATKGSFSLNIGYITALGFISYILSFILWQKILTMFDLSYIFPITAGIIQIITLIISIIVLKESVNMQNIIGVIVIIIGVILISVSKKI